MLGVGTPQYISLRVFAMLVCQYACWRDWLLAVLKFVGRHKRDVARFFVVVTPRLCLPRAWFLDAWCLPNFT